MTVDDIKQSLETASLWPDGRQRNTCLLRPCQVSTLIELDANLVRKAMEQIERTIVSLQAKLTEPGDHAAEIVLFQIFQQHAKNT